MNIKSEKLHIRIIVGILLFFGLTLIVKAQQYWAERYGGVGSEWGYAIQETTDGGYIMTGPSASYGAGGYDAWVVKLNNSGDIMWQRVFGGASDEIPNAIQQTSDGGYVIAGRTNSYGSGGLDFFVLRLDNGGNFLWMRTYGGAGDEYAYSIKETVDNGFVLIGGTSSSGAGSLDYCVIKLDIAGNIVWQRVYGGSSIDMPYAGQQTTDGGYIVAGGAASFGAGGYDVWILKLDNSGSISWQRAFGGTADDLAFSVQQTADNGYIVAGRTSSFGAGNMDFWVLKLDSLGNPVWQHTYGGGNADWVFSVRQTKDGGYVLAGRTDSFGAGSSDYWVLKLDSTGTVLWQHTYGGSALDYAYSINLTSDDDYIVAGVNASFSAGGYDALTLKLDASGNIGENCIIMGTTNIVPATPQYSITNTIVIATAGTAQSASINPNIINTDAASSKLCYFASIPGEVKNNLFVSKSGSSVGLNWAAPGATCDVKYYAVYRGDLPFSSYDHNYIDCNVSGLTYVDSSPLDNGYYLVVPLNLTREGSYGMNFDGSNWSQRPTGISVCKKQLILTCN